ncbi:hypothetical protein SAMN05216603_1023 [Pseudomonas benzenivorans]|nr:hypothetical protein SAMN05216603_1023 [Pseudomonas benzenivorans]
MYSKFSIRPPQLALNKHNAFSRADYAAFTYAFS